MNVYYIYDVNKIRIVCIYVFVSSDCSVKNKAEAPDETVILNGDAMRCQPDMNVQRWRLRLAESIHTHCGIIGTNGLQAKR